MAHRRWHDPAPEVASLVFVTLVTVAVAAIAIAHRPRYSPDDGTEESEVAKPPEYPEVRQRPSGCASELTDDECWGEVLYRTYGCVACHSAEPMVVSPGGPSLAMSWGVGRALEGGGIAVVDEAYVRESILEPQAKIAEGYGSINMPAARLSERQFVAIVAYLRVLGNRVTPPEPPTDTSRERAPRARGHRR